MVGKAVFILLAAVSIIMGKNANPAFEFVPMLGNPKVVTRDIAFSEHNRHVYKNHERSVRFGDWLYIKNNFPDRQNLCAEASGGGAGKELWEKTRTG